MRNKEYQSVQIPKDDYLILREYCEATSLKMGKFVGDLIRRSCIPLAKKPTGKVLRVENANG